MRRFLPLAAALGFTLGISIGANGQTSRPVYPDTAAGLTQFFKDVLIAAEAKNEEAVLAMTRSLVLPDHQQWFKRVFGEQISPRLIKEFEQATGSYDVRMAVLFLSLKAPKDLTVSVVKLDAIDDPNIRIYQRLAMEAMQNPLPLYSVVISLPGTSAKIEIWSLAYIDGGFRFVGKMQSIRG